MEIEISADRGIFILNNLRVGWENTYTREKYIAKIGKDIGNPGMVEQATEAMRQALQALDWIDAEIVKLKGGGKNE